MEEKIAQIKLHSTVDQVKELRIDNCEGKPKLELLQEFSNLEFLSLNKIGIQSLKNFPRLPNLKKLDLSSNNIFTTLFFLHGCQQITHLNLSNNQIKEPACLKALAKLKNLQSLLLTNCEVTQATYYRQKVFKYIKQLQDLDGVSKSMADQEPFPEDPKPVPMEGVDENKPKKRKSKAGDENSAKKLKSTYEKNALMQLNELRSGLKYNVEFVSGPSHNPSYTVSVEVDGQKYEGFGNSKQLAKHAAAQAVLLAIRGDVPTTWKPEQDFTADNDENNGMMDFCTTVKSTVKKAKAELKLLNEADKKNPVQLLNEIHPGLDFQLMDENTNSPTQRFRMTVSVSGQQFEGQGQSKKLAKQAAARSVLSHMYNVSYNMLPANFDIDPVDKNLFVFPQAIADKISKTLMATYESIMTHVSADQAKWKVIAGIVMTKTEAMDDIQVITISTGTKCINGEHISMLGATLSDCHAEIISRRCLKDFLYKNLELYLEGEGDQSILMKKEGGGFTLKPNVKFHLYISTAPCGDARIFCPHEEGVELQDRHPNRNSRGVLRTKIESGEGTIPIKSGQGIQTWDSILPGQERLLTMSCSDKVAQWNVVGLQGALLSHFIDPIYLESVILGGLFHPNHMKRALFGRFESNLEELPKSFRLNKPRMSSITSRETRHLVKSPSLSVNWTLGLPKPEIVNAVTGKTDSASISRLSKRSFLQRFLNIQGRLPPRVNCKAPEPALYATYKSVVTDYQAAKAAVTKAFAEAKLGTWVKKPVEQNDFGLNQF